MKQKQVHRFKHRWKEWDQDQLENALEKEQVDGREYELTTPE